MTAVLAIYGSSNNSPWFTSASLKDINVCGAFVRPPVTCTSTSAALMPGAQRWCEICEEGTRTTLSNGRLCLWNRVSSTNLVLCCKFAMDFDSKGFCFSHSPKIFTAIVKKFTKQPGGSVCLRWPQSALFLKQESCCCIFVIFFFLVNPQPHLLYLVRQTLEIFQQKLQPKKLE